MFTRLSKLLTPLCLLLIAAAPLMAARKPGVASPVLDGVQISPSQTGARPLTLPPRGMGITSVSTSMLAGGNRLVATQNTDGGWGWPLTGASAPNTVGAIAMGLAQAYQYTGSTAQRAALMQAGAFLLAKTDNFSPSDGYLARELDRVLGVTTYTAHMVTNFYNPLAAGTYNRGGLGTLYTTASFVLKVRTDRAAQGIANLAAWDLGVGLVGAASAGATTTEWIAGVKAEIDELDANQYYDVVGLAGAVYSLAFVNENYDPVAGAHAAAGSLTDLAAILAGYQIAGGGFTWNSAYVTPGNETNQETGYAILALNQINRYGWLTAIQGAATYLMSVQLLSGGWDNYPGDPDGENNELTGEALWGIAAAYPSPVHNVTQDVYYPTIQGAMTDATAGDQITAAAGTYTENVTVTASVQLLGAGAGSTTINGGNTGNCITLAAGGVTVDGFTLTNGHNGIGGETNNSTISNCIIHTNVNTPGSAGAGILLWGNNDNNTIQGNTVYNNDRQGIVIGYQDATKLSTGNVIRSNTIHDNGRAFPTSPDPSRYGIHLHCADQNLIHGNNVYNHLNDVNWTFSVGIYLNGSRQNTVSGNTVSNNSLNVATYAGIITGTRSTNGNLIQGNTLLNPGVWSVRTYSDAPTTAVNFNVFSTTGTSDKYIRNSGAGALNAQYNWFGGENPPQTTDFSGLVDYTHWYATDPTVSVFPSTYHMPTGSTVTLSVMAMLPAGVYARGIDATLNWSNDAAIADQGDPLEGSFFAGFPSHLYLFNRPTTSSVRVNVAILGTTPGAGNPGGGIPYVGTVFSQDFDALTEGTSVLTLSGIQLRDPNNVPITPVVVDPPGGATLVADGTAPVVAGTFIDNTTIDNDNFVKNTDNVTVTATVTDGSPLAITDITADLSGFYGGSGHTSDNPATYVGNLATWTVSGVVSSPSDGPITVTVTAMDQAANTGTGSDNITADNTLPTAAMNFVAKTVSPGGHQNVALSWTAGTDANYRGVEIRYNVWSYPTYPAGSPPSYPATPAAGSGVSVTPIAGTSTTHAIVARNAYYYSAFAVDWAGNYAALDASGTDRSVNYYLGDLGSGTGTFIPGSGGYNGQVNFDDLFWLSRLYFSSAPGWIALDPNAAEADFGPTLGNKTYGANHPFGVPGPDGVINFEDLMIFSVNYNSVVPKVEPPDGGTPAPVLAVELSGNTHAVRRGGEITMRIVLASDGREVKGTSMALSYDPQVVELEDVTAGPAFANGQGFVAHRGGSGVLQVDAAVLGTGRTVDYTTEIAAIRFRAIGNGDPQVVLRSATLRDGENRGMEAELHDNTAEIPASFSLSQNYPNPFNPETVIEYALPVESPVTLKIYNALGQEVATLVDEVQAAGYRSAVWKASDLASGVYFYRLKAGEFTELRRMLLLK